MLFRLLSERPPFEAASLREATTSQWPRAAPSVRAFQPSVPERLALLVDGCLARHPEDRPPAAELARQLSVWADVAGAPRLEQIVGARRQVVATLSSVRGLDASTSG
jgi:serine/threonine-protein kinase